MDAGPRIRVYLVDDHEIVRRGLVGFLATAEDVEVAGETGDGRRVVGDLLDAAAGGHPVDVVLLDLTMPAIDGFEVARRVSALEPAPRLVVLSAYGDMERVRLAMTLNVAGYVMKSSRPDTILDAIRAAAAGELYVDPAIAGKLAQATMTPEPATAQLTRREREVIALVAQGRSNIDIASELFISERTARTHVSHILGKLGLESRVQLALWAFDHGGHRAAGSEDGDRVRRA
jgi:DNA-binding NarL/FixJ family response regulator